MAKLHQVKREEVEITVEVLHKGEVINGKYIPAGWVKVVSGVNHETYRIDPETFMKGYKVRDNPELLAELEEANGGKL